MKTILVKIIGTAISFAITRYLIAGFQLDNSLSTYLTTAILFLLVNLVVSPLLKLIFLPINIVTLGLFRWLINVLVLYIFDLVYSGLTISGYYYAGYNSPFFSIPAGEISLFWTLVLSSFVMSLSYTIFASFFKD